MPENSPRTNVECWAFETVGSRSYNTERYRDASGKLDHCVTIRWGELGDIGLHENQGRRRAKPSAPFVRIVRVSFHQTQHYGVPFLGA